MLSRYKILIAFLALVSALKGQDINTIAGNGTNSYCGDNGPSTSACLNSPRGICVDKKGNIYIADRWNHRVRKIDLSGTIITIAGTGTAGYNGDSIPAATAQLNVPSGVAVDTAGNIFIADTDNLRIRKIDTSGILSTYAGTGVSGYNGDNIQAITAQTGKVIQLTVNNGNLYFGDADNRRIRKVDATGIITTIAGNGTYGFSGDSGLAINAEISACDGVRIDKKGNIFFSDFYNNRIRMIDTNGIIYTVAGNGGTGFSGDGGPATAAEMYHPTDLAIDDSGNVYIAGFFSQNIRRFRVGGIIVAVAGTGAAGFSGDGGPAILAQFNAPFGVALDTAGYLYISDANNNRIRKIDKSIGIKENERDQMQISVFPVPTSGEMYISGSNISDTEWNVELKDLAGRTLYKQVLPVEKGMARLKADLPDGVYFVTVKGSYGSPLTQKIIVNK